MSKQHQLVTEETTTKAIDYLVEAELRDIEYERLGMTKRQRRLQAAADAGYDTREEYRGEK